MSSTARRRRYIRLGIDGFFTDHPDLGVRAVNASVVPEPATVGLLGAGLLGLVVARRRRAPRARGR